MYNDVAITDDMIRESDDASGGKFIRLQSGGGYKFSWVFTPEKNGYYTKEDITPVLYLAVYDSTGALNDVVMTDTVTDNFMTTAEINIASGQYIMIYIWNYGNMKPLMRSLLYEE